MDRYLGDSQVATSSTTMILSTSDFPNHGKFLLAPDFPREWRTLQNDNFWQGVSGTNTRYPAGLGLPTGTEVDAERTSWRTNDAAGAFALSLKLVVADYRFYHSGTFYDVGNDSSYKSSTIYAGMKTRALSFYNNSSYLYSSGRVFGSSVRCIID